MIFDPPAAPSTNSTFRSPSNKMVGHIEDSGILCGLMKFAGDGGIPYELFFPGIEKSSIPSFRIIPVRFEMILHPNLKGNLREKNKVGDSYENS